MKILTVYSKPLLITGLGLATVLIVGCGTIMAYSSTDRIARVSDKHDTTSMTETKEPTAQKVEVTLKPQTTWQKEEVSTDIENNESIDVDTEEYEELVEAKGSGTPIIYEETTEDAKELSEINSDVIVITENSKNEDITTEGTNENESEDEVIPGTITFDSEDLSNLVAE